MSKVLRMQVRRLFLYFAVILLTVWLFGAFVLSGQSTTGVVKQEQPVDPIARAKRLEDRVQRLEAVLKQQIETNELLENKIRARQNAAIENHPEALPIQDHQYEHPDQNHPINQGVPDSLAAKDDPIAVLVIACNRSEAIKNHLNQVLKLRPSKEEFPVIVSQDCEDQATTDAVLSYGDQVTLIHQPDQRPYDLPKKIQKFLAYYKIARHYRWALNETFFKFNYKSVIITEDDLDLSVDFFEYFKAMRPLLRLDASLFCVSAWNDNGKGKLIENNSTLLWRTDFFPGLGWMLERPMWEELNAKWPEAYWDDWLRMAEQRKMRSCIRPEVPRTSMSAHGKAGASKGLYFDKHLKHISLNSQFVPFTKINLTYMLKEAYDKAFVDEVYKWPSITQHELRSGVLTDGSALPKAIRLTYEEKGTYKSTAKAFGLMEDFRAGVPRMAYRGVVAFMFEKTRVYLAPPPNWTNYDPTWN